VAYSQDVDAQVQSCAACHGENGVPADPKTTPIIWGQTEYWILKALRSYQRGERQNAVMEAVAKSLKYEDTRPIAHHFAEKIWPENSAKTASAPENSANNAPPAEPNGIAVCKICHQENFQGALPAPRLAGLSYEYLIAQMRAFGNDQRTDNEDMPKIMKQVSDSDREAMARYLAGL
jgi:cytochrome c553